LLRIRLSRIGKKKQPAYRLVVADQRAPREGAFLKIIGHYNPRTEPVTLVVKEDEAVYWLQKGAQPSETAAKLLTRLGVMEKAGKTPVRYEGKQVEPGKRGKKGAAAEAAAPAAAPAAAAAEAPAEEAPEAAEEPAAEAEAEPAAEEAAPEAEAEEAPAEPEASEEPEEAPTE
jgi:small subunit ribosomal protein S16